MAEATLSSKNQIVIPREAREALDLKPGDKLVIRAVGGKIIVMENRSPIALHSLASLADFIPKTI